MMTLSDRILKKFANSTLADKYTNCGNFQMVLEKKIHLNIYLKTMQQKDVETGKLWKQTKAKRIRQNNRTKEN